MVNLKNPYWIRVLKYYLFFWDTFKIKDSHLYLLCPPYFVCWKKLDKLRLFGTLLYKKIL